MLTDVLAFAEVLGLLSVHNGYRNYSLYTGASPIQGDRTI